MNLIETIKVTGTLAVCCTRAEVKPSADPKITEYTLWLEVGVHRTIVGQTLHLLYDSSETDLDLVCNPEYKTSIDG